MVDRTITNGTIKQTNIFSQVVSFFFRYEYDTI